MESTPEIAPKRPSRTAFLLPVFVIGYVLLFFLVQSPKLLDYYRVSDDARQQIYPLYLHIDPTLFQDDLLTRYFRSHTPPVYYYLHYPVVQVVDPIVWSKVAQIALLLVVLVFLFLIGRKLHGAALGWVLVFLFVHARPLSGLTDGGLPRAYAIPALVIFIWACLTDRSKTALGATTLAALFYPPVLLVLGPSFVLWAFLNRRFTVWAIPAALLVLGGIYPMVARGDEIGRIITHAAAAQMPEWHAENRFPYLPPPSILELLPTKLSSALVTKGTVTSWIWMALTVALLWRRREEIRKLQPILILLLASVAMYWIATFLAFRLHIPDRTLIYSLPLVGLLAGAFAFTRLPLFPPILILMTLILEGSGLDASLNLWADQRYASRFYQFVSEIPRDAVLAGPPLEMDSIPLFSRRIVFVSDEAAQPLYDAYYREMRRRLQEFYTAYYATDAKAVMDFARRNRVGFMVIKKEDFTFQFNRQKYYHEPYNKHIKQLLRGREAQELFFAHPPECSVIYDDGYLQLVQLDESCLTPQRGN
ncbi:MAG: hypothetical protein HY645_05535 [Acidobacteria bacterium]|nr:hypothetical protein [Acidobacteriota bacterium]